jgi:hypothetical protein
MRETRNSQRATRISGHRGRRPKPDATRLSNSPFMTHYTPETLATAQGVSPVTDFDELLGDFWPEEESADDFIAAIREWRCEPGAGKSA